jgi:hypothetical protein
MKPAPDEYKHTPVPNHHLPPGLPRQKSAVNMETLPRMGDHQHHAPRLFTIKITLQGIRKAWKNLLKSFTWQ